MQRVYRRPHIAGEQAFEATCAAPLAPARTPSTDLEPSTDPLCPAYPLGGPVDAPAVDEVGQAIGQAASPLALYSAFAGDVPAPAELVELSAAVVAAGNWAGCDSEAPGFQSAPLEIDPSLDLLSRFHTPGESPGPQAADELENQSDPQYSTCNNLDSWGDNLNGDYGNCTLYCRDLNEETNWHMDDAVAPSAHVSQAGYHDWYVEHRNCNVAGCNWYTDYHQWSIDPGYHYYYYRANNNDDFKGHSAVQSNGNTYNHYHDVARIHDWDHRTWWSSYWDQAHGIKYSGSSLYCTETPLEGTDPSNIVTSADWDTMNRTVDASA